jgi:hypothetical protein
VLADLIYRKLRLEHVGESHAILREDLLTYINSTYLGGVISDRDMRRAIENHLPGVLSGPKGYWLPDPATQNQDVNKAVGYLTKKIIGLSNRRKRILEEYPGAKQGELFQ